MKRLIVYIKTIFKIFLSVRMIEFILLFPIIIKWQTFVNNVFNLYPLGMKLLFIFILLIPDIIWSLNIFCFNEYKYLEFGKEGNHIDDDVLPFRDIPCNNDLFRAFFLGRKYGKFIDDKSNLIKALLMKWYSEGHIKFSKVKKSFFDLENEIIFLSLPFEKGEDVKLELEVFNMIFKSSRDGVLSEGEFKEWISSEYNEEKLYDWYGKVIRYEMEKLRKEGKLERQVVKKISFINNHYIDKYIVSPELKKEAELLYGSKKFYKDFTRLNKKEPIEIKLLNEYMVFAALLGETDQISKYYNEIYPDIDNIQFDQVLNR